MTEHQILKILLGNNVITNYSFDYPKLQKEAANIIAENVTDIIYESLKQKSSASNMKRGNTLKFLNKLCETTDAHFNDHTTNVCFSSTLCNNFETEENEEIVELVDKINKELEIVIPVNITDRVITFYINKNTKQKERHRRIELIKINDQKKLDCKFNLQVRKNIPYYEIDENFIRDALGNSLKPDRNKTILYGVEYREKQIKLAYALINLNINDTGVILERILRKLSKSNSLTSYEENFLMYFWTEYGLENCNHEDIFLNSFFFVIEIIIIRYGHKLLGIGDEDMCYKFFTNLEDDKSVLKIRNISRKHPRINFKVKNLIYELYCFSYCNDNILKLCDIFI